MVPARHGWAGCCLHAAHSQAGLLAPLRLPVRPVQCQPGSPMAPYRPTLPCCCRRLVQEAGKQKDREDPQGSKAHSLVAKVASKVSHLVGLFGAEGTATTSQGEWVGWQGLGKGHRVWPARSQLPCCVGNMPRASS